MTREKLNIPINEPTTVKILFDTPITGESSYGPYSMYAVLVDGVEYSYFAPPEVNEKLKFLRKGDLATITKLAAQHGNKLVTTYEVKSDKLNNKQQNADSQIREEEELVLNAKSDKYFDVMLKSYEEGIIINDKLNGMADVSKIAVTLFIARSKVC